MTALADFAPRLARAHAQRREELRRGAAAERHRVTMLDKAERLVIHRELQLIRAGRTGDARYIKRRQDKLDAARAQVARWTTGPARRAA